jgi:peroxiredoxin
MWLEFVMAILRRLAVFACLASICFGQQARRKCADVPLKTTDGKTIHFAQYRGKVVIIVMVVTTDDPCLKMLQFMARLQNELGPQGLQIAGVSIDDTSANVTPYAERYRFPFPIGHLDKQAAIKLADLKPTARPFAPYLMFVDWQGIVRFQYPGNDPFVTSGEKNIRVLADGLLRQAAEKKGPQLQAKPIHQMEPRQ